MGIPRVRVRRHAAGGRRAHIHPDRRDHLPPATLQVHRPAAGEHTGRAVQGATHNHNLGASISFQFISNSISGFGVKNRYNGKLC
jgi:hypothetical protein